MHLFPGTKKLLRNMSSSVRKESSKKCKSIYRQRFPLVRRVSPIMYQPLQSSPPSAQNECDLPAQDDDATKQAPDAAGSPLLSQDHDPISARSSKVIQDDGRTPFPRYLTPSTSEVGWRPITITAPFILLFSLITIGLMCALEYLLQRSQSRGAVVCTSSSYALDYMPVVVAVIFSLLWASIDHDVKRYERAALPRWHLSPCCRWAGLRSWTSLHR